MVRFRINVTKNKDLCCNGDLSGSKSRSKFPWCKGFISCYQRKNIEKDSQEVAKQRRFLHASQTSTGKLPDKSSDLFDEPAMTDRPGGSQQFRKPQSRITLHPDLHRHSL